MHSVALFFGRHPTINLHPVNIHPDGTGKIMLGVIVVVIVALILRKTS